jgi:hypothetical protein
MHCNKPFQDPVATSHCNKQQAIATSCMQFIVSNIAIHYNTSTATSHATTCCNDPLQQAIATTQSQGIQLRHVR